MRIGRHDDQPRRERCVPALCLGVLAAMAALDRPLAASADDSVMRASVMQVGVRRASGRLAVGSAVIVSPGFLVTACHGTRDADAIVLMHGGEQLPVKAVSEDRERDLCVLSAPSVRGPVPQLGDTGTLRVGDEVVAIGFSSGFRLSVSTGTVKALYGHDGARVIRTSAWFSTGASGGGLFDRQGRLVGILSFKSTAGDDHHYAMPVEWIDTGLTGPPNAREPAGHAFWEHEEARQPYFLRAAWLEGTRAWSELAGVALAWTQAQPHDVEAWLALARANTELERWHTARDALTGAAALDPQHAGLRASRELSADWQSGREGQLGEALRPRARPAQAVYLGESASRPR